MHIITFPCPILTGTTERSAYFETVGSHREICDFCIDSGEGNFTSYGYPLEYKPSLNCSYRVRRTNSDVCELEMIFHDFDVPVSKLTKIDDYVDCSEDYLEVYGRRFCGKHWKGRKEIVPFPANVNEITFYFHSDQAVSGRGFWVELRQIPNTCFEKKPVQVCEERFSSDEFYITSPRFPNDYPSNAECKYYIRKSANNVCGLQLTFLHFDLEAVNDCFYDRLQIDDQKYCGTLPPNTVKTIAFPEDQKIFTFVSDKQAASTGFQVRVKQLMQCKETKHLPPPPSCNICTSDTNGILVSYNYPNNYRNNLACMYHIEKKDHNYCALRLTFDYFDIMSSTECSQDYLLMNGQRFCGTILHSKTKELKFGADDSLNFLFKTDESGNSKGFSLKYTQILCDEKTQNRETVKPNFEVTHELYTEMSGVPQNCDQTHSQKSFTIRSESIANLYPNNLDCTYLVRKNSSNVCYLEFTFVKFDVEASPQCNFDYLEVNKIRLCGTLQKETMRSYIFEENEKKVNFHTDSSTNREGFVIEINQLECQQETLFESSTTASTAINYQPLHSSVYGTRTCDQTFETQEFEIISPEYPKNYPFSTDCIFTIRKVNSEICRLDVTHHEFRVHSSDSNGYCRYDYLDFNGIRICGEVMQGSVRSFYFPENTFNVTFHSDAMDTEANSGFRLTVKQTECGNIVTRRSKAIETDVKKCEKVFTTATFELKSINYPEMYPKNVNCEYRVLKKSNGVPVCKLEVHFTDFQLEEDIDCHGDFVEFEGTRICGPQPKKLVKFFPFDKSVFTIKFRSDGKQRRQNKNYFFMHIRQHECPDVFSIARLTSPPHILTPSTEQTERNEQKVCEVVVKDAVFEIKSPMYPFSYKEGTKCKFIIKKFKNNVCRLDLTFNSFQIGDNSCRSDFLAIEDGEQLCGSIPRDTFKMYTFDSNEKIIFFKGETAGQLGFHIRGRQIECFDYRSKEQEKKHPVVERRFRDQKSNQLYYCDQTFSKSLLTISSPNYPNSYPNDVHCTYTIIRPNSSVCALDMKFSVFDIDDDPKCAKDYLEIDTGKVCGILPPNHERRYYYFPDESKKLLIFHTNSLTSKSGFLVQIKQITDCAVHSWKPESLPPPVCDLCSHEIRGYFTSINYPKYYDNYARCIYRISAHSDQYCSVRLHIRDLDIEESTGCHKDYLFIENDRICNSNYRPKEITLHFPQLGAKEIQFSFHADSRKNGRGFYIEYLQEMCTSQIKPGNTHQYLPVYGQESQFSGSYAHKGEKGKTHSQLQYPENHVYKALTEEIVETKVKVLDSRSDPPPTVDHAVRTSFEVKPVSINVQLPAKDKTNRYSTRIFK